MSVQTHLVTRGDLLLALVLTPVIASAALTGISYATSKKRIGVVEQPQSLTEQAMLAVVKGNIPLIRSDIVDAPIFEIAHGLCVKYGVQQMAIYDNWSLPKDWDMDVFDSTLRNYLSKYPDIGLWELWPEVNAGTMMADGSFLSSRTGYLDAPYPIWLDRFYEVMQHFYSIVHSYGRTVIGPCFAVYGENDTRMPMYFDFANRGAGMFTDYVAIHPYNFVTYTDYWRNTLQQIREAFGKPLWATEFGLSDLKGNQAEYVPKFLSAFEYLFDQLTFYELRDDPNAGIEDDRHYGLLTAGYVEKPVFNVVKAFNTS